jgi:hypothetical protein
VDQWYQELASLAHFGVVRNILLVRVLETVLVGVSAKEMKLGMNMSQQTLMGHITLGDDQLPDLIYLKDSRQDN